MPNQFWTQTTVLPRSSARSAGAGTTRSGNRDEEVLSKRMDRVHTPTATAPQQHDRHGGPGATALCLHTIATAPRRPASLSPAQKSTLVVI
jgi:hypothetical protein